MRIRLISSWYPAASSHEAASEPSADVPWSGSGRGREDDYLLATAESMLRAGHGHKEIERTLRRMAPSVGRDPGLLAGFRPLRRLLAYRGRTFWRRSTKLFPFARSARPAPDQRRTAA